MKYLLLLVTFFLVHFLSGQSLLITGIMDGPLPGGKPKLLELFAYSDINDLSAYAIGSANNGGGTDGPEFILSGTAMAGDYLYISTDAFFFNFWFGLSPDFSTSVINVNGNDAVELFYDTTKFFLGAELLVDIYGQADINGSGTAWDYMDSWAVRSPKAKAKPQFDSLDWIFGGVNRLDPYSSQNHIASDSDAFPLQTYSLVYNGASWNSSFNINGLGSSNISLPDTFLGDIYIQGGTAELKTTKARSLYIRDSSHLNIGTSLSLEDTLLLKLNSDKYPQIKGFVSSPIKIKTDLVSDSLSRWFNLGIPLITSWRSLKSTQSASPLYQADSVNNLFSFKNGKWTRIVSIDDSVLPMGYSVFLGLPYFDSLPAHIEISGHAYLNSFSIPLDSSTSNKWNFLANPFLAQISWSKHLINNPKLSSTYYVHDDERGLWYSYNPMIPAALQDDELGDAMAPMQSFFVKSDSAKQMIWSQSAIEMKSTSKRYKSNLDVLGLELYVSDSLVSKVALVFNEKSNSQNQRLDSELRLSAGAKAELAFSLNGLNYRNKFMSQSAVQEIPLNIITKEPAIELRLNTTFVNKERFYYVKNLEGKCIHDFREGVFSLNKENEDFNDLILCWNDFLDLGKPESFSMNYTYLRGVLNFRFSQEVFINEVRVLSLDAKLLKNLKIERSIADFNVLLEKEKSKVVIVLVDTKEFGLITKKIHLP